MSTMPKPVITTMDWAPPGARGLVRDVRARWACEEEGIAYDLRLIPFPPSRDGAYRECQPWGQVPFYSDGEVAIFESGAIVLHIAEQGTVLLPAEPSARATAIQWMFAALVSVEPYIFQKQQVELFEKDEPWSPMRRPKVDADLGSRLQALAGTLGDKTWLDGDRFTLGDLMMVSIMNGIYRSGVLDAHPVLKAYVERGQARPAHVKAKADQIALYEAADAR